MIEMYGTNVSVRTIVQKIRRAPATLLVMLFVFTAAAAYAETMPISAVKKGMKGYGITVFEGTTPEKFDVEILGVLYNIGPGQDLILAKIDSPVVRRTGVIAGMSGSPIYIDGKVIGALAYAWQFSKEPVAGITPIDEMLKIARNGGTTNAQILVPVFGDRAAESAETFFVNLYAQLNAFIFFVTQYTRLRHFRTS